MDASATGESMGDIDVLGVMRLIPHRYPFLMVDRVTGVVPNVKCTGIKNVTINEPFFQGHFPRRPVMPGVMIIESMAQTAAVLVMHSMGQSAEHKVVYFMTLDNARFRRPVLPGDQLAIHVELIHARRNVWKFGGEAKVEGKLCAEAVFAAMIADL